MSRLRRLALCLLLLAAALIALAVPARAHDPGLSKGEYAVDPEEVTLTFGLSRRDLPLPITIAKGAPLPANDALDRELISKFSVTRKGADGAVTRCESNVVKAEPDQDDGLTIVARFTDCGAAADVTIDLTEAFKVMPIGASHTVFVDDADGHREHVLHAGRPSFTARAIVPIDVPLSAPPAPKSQTAGPLRRALPFAADLLAYFIALLAPLAAQRASRKTLLALAAPYALAAALTFVLSTQAVFTPSARSLTLIVPLTALYFAIENLLARRSSAKLLHTRPRAATSFGLLHGFVIANEATAARPTTDPASLLAACFAAFMLLIAAFALLAPPPEKNKPSRAIVVKLLSLAVVAIGLFRLMRAIFWST